MAWSRSPHTTSVMDAELPVTINVPDLWYLLLGGGGRNRNGGRRRSGRSLTSIAPSHLWQKMAVVTLVFQLEVHCLLWCLWSTAASRKSLDKHGSTSQHYSPVVSYCDWPVRLNNLWYLCGQIWIQWTVEEWSLITAVKKLEHRHNNPPARLRPTVVNVVHVKPFPYSSAQGLHVSQASADVHTMPHADNTGVVWQQYLPLMTPQSTDWKNHMEHSQNEIWDTIYILITSSAIIFCLVTPCISQRTLQDIHEKQTPAQCRSVQVQKPLRTMWQRSHDSIHAPSPRFSVP